jgi:hypothetical protein
VPLAGIEPALLAELDFESSASTSSATGALTPKGQASALYRDQAAGVNLGRVVFLVKGLATQKSARKVEKRLMDRHSALL